MSREKVWYRVTDSPVGKLRIGASQSGLCELEFFARRSAGAAALSAKPAGEEPPLLAEAMRQLGEYFAGDRQQFDLALAAAGTRFQLAVWRALVAIPYGRTVSYGELARQIDRPGASRAVGAANGANPIAIVVPCHRVIGADGSLTGFGGGLPIKRALLALERKHVRIEAGEVNGELFTAADLGGSAGAPAHVS